MLQLQTASAGSGKTYTLAKKFIWNFIASGSVSTGSFRLRNPQELPEALRSILAITFTNMATEEMKQRIIEKLNSLAYSTLPDDKVDYLTEFMNLANVSRKSVSNICRHAISLLLNEFSNFNVSTIDSFFQSVLRTFAYEADLNDSYQVELDSSYICRVGLDSVLESINSQDKDSFQTKYWIESMMRRNIRRGRAWNIFARSSSKESIYSELLNVAEKMESEDFKQVSVQLDDYFKKHSDFPEFTQELYRRYGEPLDRLGEICHNLAARILKEMPLHGLCDIKSGNARLTTNLRRAMNYRTLSARFEPVGKFPLDRKLTLETGEERHTVESIHSLGAEYGNLPKLIATFFKNAQEFCQLITDPGTTHWRIYEKHFPHMGIMMEINRNGKEFLEANNTVQLSDTSSILQRIINDDDTPFIYERIGTRLNHYLIDEFQDTSRMQWVNLRPLLKESDSRGEDNLIIGDPKQSIYRFRNADPDIITIAVPESFPTRIDTGRSPVENTNWRSDRNIIGFNNIFFRTLARILDLRLEDMGGFSFEALYSNTVQRPADNSGNGYVEIRFYNPDSEEESPQLYDSLGPLVESLLERGYRQRDIAILTRTNGSGQNVINALTHYNANRSAENRPIEFVSEQSLKVASSPAVRIIIAALRAISGGASVQLRQGAEMERRGLADWSDIAADFNFFSARHPELSPAQCMDEFLKTDDTADSINNLLASMQSVALPALVEAVAGKYISPEMRSDNAPFIAAFQDIVLEYCENSTADTASFLKWWDAHGNNASITSPAETDAVRVMTVHKAKGLEFGVVIIPEADNNFAVSRIREEWRWVRPGLLADLNPDLEFPPYLPVTTGPDLLDTEHSDIRRQFVRLVAMDSLNSVYVAFTRAVHELYILAPLKITSTKNGVTRPSSPDSLGAMLWNIASDIDKTINEADSDPDRQWFLTTGLTKTEEYAGEFFHTVTRCGMYHDSQAIRTFNKKKKTENTTAPLTIGSYTVNTDTPLLSVTEMTKPEEEEDTGVNDPRAEGSMLHSIMQDIETVNDIDRAVRRMRLSGRMDITRLSSARTLLENAIRHAMSDPRSACWFDGTMRILNERDIIIPGKGISRPDRIMTDRKGRAIVIDYKFGAEPSSESRAAHRRQTLRYARLLQNSGMFPAGVEAVVWYVRRNEFCYLTSKL